ISYGKFIRYTDGVIISSALFLPEVGIDGVIYGFVMVAVFSYTVDMILSGNQQSSQIFIVSKDYKAMADAINNDAKRGATVIDAIGWYSKNDSKVVMCVCRKRDLAMVLKVVRSVDPDAFITIGSVMGVYGKGFDALNKV
ncbi:MAG: YitT family protein, partial [Alistipes sp.]|nr:YitT family protein [Alistipes sp.]